MAFQYGGYHESQALVDLYDYSYTGIGGVDFFIECSKITGGDTLELGCGTGRILIPTAIAGFEITGLDLSVYMLKKCEEKLRLQNSDTIQHVQLVQGNMVDFKIDHRFSLITIPFNTFQHIISVNEQRAVLADVKDHLTDSGLFVLDVFNPDLPRLHDFKYQQEQVIFSDLKLPDGRILNKSSRIAAFHRAEQFNDVELIYYSRYPDGREERLVQAFPFRYYFRYELEHLLGLCGFRAMNVFGDYDRSPFSDKSPKMIFLAKNAN